MSESFAVRDEGSAWNYIVDIPRIVLALGLTPYELSLYCHMRAAGGMRGRCTKSTATLVKETRMSAGKITQVKESLAQPRPELGGRSLITIKEVSSGTGGRSRHIITFTDLWEENVQHVRSARSSSEVASSPHELPTEKASSPHERSNTYTDTTNDKDITEGANDAPAPVKKKSRRAVQQQPALIPEVVDVNDTPPVSAAPPRQDGASTVAEKPAPLSAHPAIQAWLQHKSRYPKTKQMQQIIERVGDDPKDVAFWTECVEAHIRLTNADPLNITPPLDWFLRREIPNHLRLGGPRPASQSAARTNPNSEYERAKKSVIPDASYWAYAKEYAEAHKEEAW